MCVCDLMVSCQSVELSSVLGLIMASRKYQVSTPARISRARPVTTIKHKERSVSRFSTTSCQPVCLLSHNIKCKISWENEVSSFCSFSSSVLINCQVISPPLMTTFQQRGLRIRKLSASNYPVRCDLAKLTRDFQQMETSLPHPHQGHSQVAPHTEDIVH